MRAYSKEIPGLVHERSEDACYENIFSLSDGKEVGLFMVADGLSGSAGMTASHLAVSTLWSSVYESISRGRVDYGMLLSDAVLTANAKLEALVNTYTCLDVALVADALYLVHLGDSRVYSIGSSVEQITEDESVQGRPTNYLGKGYLEGEPRPQVQTIPLEGIDFLFLTTDGLMTRLTKEEIREQLLRLKGAENPKAIIDELTQLVYYPLGKFDHLSPTEVVHFTNGGVVSIDDLRKAYGEGLNTELVQKVNKGGYCDALRFDDTTMVLVDLKDKATGAIRSEPTLKENIFSLEESVARLNTLMEEKVQQQSVLQGKYNDLEINLVTSQGEVSVLSSQLEGYRVEVARLEGVCQQTESARNALEQDYHALDAAIGEVRRKWYLRYFDIWSDVDRLRRKRREEVETGSRWLGLKNKGKTHER